MDSETGEEIVGGEEVADGEGDKPVDDLGVCGHGCSVLYIQVLFICFRMLLYLMIDRAFLLEYFLIL